MLWLGSPSRSLLVPVLTAAVVSLSAVIPAWGQAGPFDLGAFGDIGGKNAGAQIALSASLYASDVSPGGLAVLTVTATLPESYYIYSTKSGFSGATKISVLESAGLEPIDEDFRADREPKVEFHAELGDNGLDVEKFYSSVTWYRRYRIADQTNGRPTKYSDISSAVKFQGQYCGGKDGRAECIPIRPPRLLLGEITDNPLPESIRAKVETVEVLPFAATVVPTRKSGKTSDPVSLEFSLNPENAKPDENVTLTIAMTITDPEFHTFGLDQNPKNAGLPTVLKFEKLRNLQPLGSFRSDKESESVMSPLGFEQRQHSGSVVWTQSFRVTRDEPGGYGVDGSIRYQICDHGSCLPPRTVPVKLGVQPSGLAKKAAPRPKVDLSSLTFVVTEDGDAPASLGMYLLYAFLGGMILNVMPCVLPVIAIKVLSFVQQAGESRGRILALNVAYSGGVISVFLVLATLAVGLGIGWGGLFQKPEFNLVMACLVFAMGLSLLGVFEIPVPGMIGSAAGSQHQEGLAGAFMTGIFATLLATPCSGPFLGATLAWSVLQPKLITYLVWGVMGLGMAFPYLVFGMFPGAIRWLPKPGNWMVRFKEISGFVLMGSVVFIISYLNQKFVVPALIMLMGVAFGLWMIGNLYDFNSKTSRKVIVRTISLVVMGLVCGFGYRISQGELSKHKLPWKDFSEAALSEVIGQKTVLVDFTADWCLTCKLNEGRALNTSGTLELIERHEIVPLYADYTDQSPEIKKWLDTFKSKSVPLTVIIPADRPDRPLLLRDLYSQSKLHRKLEDAISASGVAQGTAPGSSQVSRDRDARR